jgi:hypothetical protein
MTRMVDENRLQMGTLKALGYSNTAIAGKYLFYGLASSILGSILGHCDSISIRSCRFFRVENGHEYSVAWDGEECKIHAF